jgi:hypothetical protein
MHTLSLMSGSHAWGVPLHLASDDAGDTLDSAAEADAAAAAAFDKEGEEEKEEDENEEDENEEEQKLDGELVAPILDYLGEVAWQRLTPSLCQNENNMT